MNSNLKIALALPILLVLFQCSSTRKTSDSRERDISGTYRLSMITSSTEGFTLNINNAEGSYHEALTLIKAENPNFIPDSSAIKQKIEGNIENLSRFLMIFRKDGAFSQSAFVMEDTLIDSFRGTYMVKDNELILTHSDGKLFDRYEYVEKSNDSLTLIQREESKSGEIHELIFILNKQ